MLLYAARHAEAKPAEIDPAPGLTAAKKIYHSGKTRTHETASILAARIRPVRGVVETDGLGPQDDPQIRCASMLLCGDPEKTGVHFKMAGSKAPLL